MEKNLNELSGDFKIGEEVYENKIENDVQINQSDLDFEFLNQARRFVYYAFLAEQAKAMVTEAGIRVKVIYAQQDQKARDEGIRMAEKVKGFRMTEKMVENQAYTSDEHMGALKELNQAKLTAGILEQCKQAMLQRRDMLLQLGANYRSEGAADPVILMEAAKEKARRIANEKFEEVEDFILMEAAKEKARLKEIRNTVQKTKKSPMKPGKR